jgi:hypothetical protein
LGHEIYPLQEDSAVIPSGFCGKRYLKQIMTVTKTQMRLIDENVLPTGTFLKILPCKLFTSSNQIYDVVISKFLYHIVVTESEKTSLFLSTYTNLTNAGVTKLDDLKILEKLRESYDAHQHVLRRTAGGDASPTLPYVIAPIDDIDAVYNDEEVSDEIPTESELQTSRTLIQNFDQVMTIGTEDEPPNISHQMRLFYANVAETERIENNGVGVHRSIDDVYNDLISDINDLSEIAMYPKYGTHGAVGTVHYNRVWLEVNYAGPDGDEDHFDDVVNDDPLNTLITTDHRLTRDCCINGGQIYNPSNVNSDFSKVSDSMKLKLDQFTAMVSDYLSSNMPGTNAERVEKTKSDLIDVIQTVDKLCEAWIDHEQRRDNPLLRFELTMVHKESNTCALQKIDLYWPIAGGDIYSDVRKSVFVVPQSDIFKEVQCFHKENVVPLKLLMTKPNESVMSYSADTKTRLLWCAESVVRETGNRFFMGKIHNFIKKVSNRGGKFSMHNNLKEDIPQRDRTDLLLEWGINSHVLSSKFKCKSKSDNKIAAAQLFRSAIRNHKGKIDFPTIFVECRSNFWVTTQRFSMNKNKHHDIGFFEQPNWESLACMNDTKTELFVQTLLKTLLMAYRKNWFYILKQYSAQWTNRLQAASFTEFPLSYNDVMSTLSGSLYVTTDNSPEASAIGANVLTAKDKTPVTTPGRLCGPGFCDARSE